MTSTLEAVAQRWLVWVVSATWQIALLVAIVAAMAWILRRASPRLRYALWLLVLVKVFLPPTLTIGWSVGNWGVRPFWNSVEPTAQQFLETQSAAENHLPTLPDDVKVASGDLIASDSLAPNYLSPTLVLFAVWSLGCIIFLGVVFWHYLRLKRAIAGMPLIEEGPLRVRLEAIALQLGLKQIPQLHLSDVATSPFLIGVTRPQIVLPRQMAEELGAADLDSVLLHELSHWRRRDTWIGWLQVFGQSLFWFHPLVWWANGRLRHERECVCDEAVLRTGACEPVDYGQALLGVLSAARGRSLVQGSLVGVFEPGGNIQNRLEEIMNYEPGKREFGFWSRATVVALAVLFLPMAIPTLSADTDTNIAEEEAADTVINVAEKETVEVRHLPWIVETNPPVGSTDVDPKLSEITITFDRDMGSGASPTGDERSFFPPIAGDSGGHWRNSRTWILPVNLSRGQYYRVGINSKSYHDFTSQKGEPAPCSVLYFVTKGATKSVQNRVRVPKIIKLVPENGAGGADPGTKRLIVSFDIPMGEGMSWTGGGENFPQVPKGLRSKWISGGKTCVLPVELKPGWDYRLGINSRSHINFQSKWGVPIESVEYSFRTAGDSSSTESSLRVPKIVKLSPANGAKDVDPGTKQITVTFNMPMGEGMSWTGGGENFPQVPKGLRPKWTNGGKTCVLPVKLKPGWDYRLGINSRSYTNFKSKSGVPVKPVEYRFRTAEDSSPAAGRTSQDIDPTIAKVRGWVEKYFSNNFRDVKQRKTIEWGPVTEGENGNVSIRYKYHTKIWDKEAMVMNQVFVFKSDGECVGWSNVEGFPEK